MIIIYWQCSASGMLSENRTDDFYAVWIEDNKPTDVTVPSRSFGWTWLFTIGDNWGSNYACVCVCDDVATDNFLFFFFLLF